MHFRHGFRLRSFSDVTKAQRKPMSDQKNVCSKGWNGVHGSTITLENHNSNTVTVDGCGDPDYPFPFSSPNPPFSVPSKVGANPGTIPATLKNAPGNYHYCTAGCPGDITESTNPKTVIIT
jgi:hypothetical protein